MSATAAEELRPEWECSECGMRVYNTKEDRIAQPRDWEDGACFRCRVENTEDPDERARILLRAGCTFTAILRESGLKETRLKAIRRELIEAGEIGPTDNDGPVKKPAKKGPSWDEKFAKVEEALRENHDRPDQDIADECGVKSRVTVRKVRRRLGLPKAPTRAALNDRRVEAEVRAHPDLDDGEVAALLGDTGSYVVRRVRGAAGLPRPKTAQELARERVEEALRAHPERANMEIADELHTRARRVRQVRQELGLPKAPSRQGRRPSAEPAL